MFNAIKKIGSFIIEKEKLGEEEVFIEKTKMTGARFLCAVFKLGDKDVVFSEIHGEEYRSARWRKYLYKTFGHGRYDVTPTTRFLSTERTKKRTVLWFKIFTSRYSDWLIQALKDEIDRKGDNIFSDVSKKYNELDREERRNLMFTIKMKEGEEEKYLGEYEIFRRIFKEESLGTLFAKYKVESKGVAICHLCGKNKEVFGFASPFSFYTFDKRGFAPNFIREDAWKRLPVCVECAVALEAGKQFLNKYLLKNFYGFKFYVIPKFAQDVNEDWMEYIENANKRDYAKSILCKKGNILSIIAEKESIFSLIFMFIQPKQKDFFDIIKYVDDVPPSWIDQIYNVLGKVETVHLIGEDSLKKILGRQKVGGLGDLTIGGLVRPFFPHPDYDKHFIDVVGDILSQRRINKALLIKAFIKEIRKMHVKKKAMMERFLCLKSFILLLVLSELELIRYVSSGSHRMVDEKVMTGKAKKVKGFLEEYKMAFDSADKKATFLIGVLAKMLLDVQYANRKSTPFRSKLYSLKLNERRLKRIFPEIVVKLEEYDVFYPRLREYISEILVKAEDNGWKLSNDEISYYFALGVNLGGVFK